MTKFYTFVQNNSGGFFDNNESRGLAKFVIVEAGSAEHANRRALRIGLYFDGGANGEDCNCCGDRWYEVSESDGSDVPLIYDTPPAEFQFSRLSLVQEGECFCFVHHLDGTGTGFRKGSGVRSGFLLGPGD